MITASKVTEVIETSTYTLSFDQKIGQLLFDITGRIGGCPDNSRRGEVDELRASLRDLGFNWSRDEANDISQGMTFVPGGSLGQR